MKHKCKKCGANTEGNEFCWKHKPKKQLKSKRMITIYMSSDSEKAFNEAFKAVYEFETLFTTIWKKREHVSEVGGTYLGEEPNKMFFHHILAKSKYPQFRDLEENIILLTPEEHATVEQDMYRYEEINIRREYLKRKYNL